MVEGNMIWSFAKQFLPLILMLNLFFNSVSYSNGFDGRKANIDIAAFENHLQHIYTSCKLQESGLDYKLFRQGAIGFYNARNKHSSSASKNILSIIDFKKASTDKRLWIIDMLSKNLLYHSLVAHGKNTGENEAVNFSNCSNSNMSSIGFYVTENCYSGKHGLSLVIEGLDANFNTNAKIRSVVIHSADYVSEEFIKCNGRLGRSQGCPAIPVEDHKEVINTIKEGTVLYIYYPCSNYSSKLLNETIAIEEFQRSSYK
jgi:hypothetical protein